MNEVQAFELVNSKMKPKYEIASFAEGTDNIFM